MQKVRFAANYGVEGHMFDEVFSYDSFCPECERQLGEDERDYRFCPFCGVAIDTSVTFKDNLEDPGPKGIHPLVEKELKRQKAEEQRQAADKVAQPDDSVPFCDACRDMRVSHIWDDEKDRQPDSLVLYMAGSLRCSVCKKLLHNCGSYFNPKDWSTQLTCSPGVKVEAVPLSESSPSDPYGLHMAGYRGTEESVG